MNDSQPSEAESPQPSPSELRRFGRKRKPSLVSIEAEVQKKENMPMLTKAAIGQTSEEDPFKKNGLARTPNQKKQSPAPAPAQSQTPTIEPPKTRNTDGMETDMFQRMAAMMKNMESNMKTVVQTSV